MQETDETVANIFVANIFTKGSHHRNVSVVFLAQNLFPQNKFTRATSLNAHYIVLFKKEPYSYLLIDLRPEHDEDLRPRTDIFPGEKH